MTLYEINNELLNLYASYEATIDENGEITDKTEEILQAIEAQKLDRTEKIEDIVLCIKNMKSDAEQLKKEAATFTARAKSAQRKAARLEEYLKNNLYGEVFFTAKCSITWRKSEAVECSLYPAEYESTIPQYLRYAPPELDKTAIRAALKAGEEIPGCRLEERLSMTIK